MTRRYFAIVMAVVALLITQLACVQDCIQSNLQVIGRVQDDAGNPIPDAEVEVDLSDDGFSDPFHQVVVTDANGRFASDFFDMFACDTLTVQVRADGYAIWNDQFNGIHEEWPDELPPELIITLYTVDASKLRGHFPNKRP